MFIKNANIITFDGKNRIIENGGILINSEGNIEKICSSDKQKQYLSGLKVVDAAGKYVMPGGICAHTHFYGAFSRGMYIPGDPPNSFPEILDKLWWRLDKSLDQDAVFYSALVCLIDAIRHGTTTLFDHHASPNNITGSLDTIANAVKKSGVRASLCYETTDRDGKDKSNQGIEENKRFIKRVQNKDFDAKMINATFGLHASLTLYDATLEKAAKECPQGYGFHIHAAEHPVDEYDSIKKSGMRVVERLEKFHILGPNTIIAHGVHIDINEVCKIAESKTWLTHQPRSNMNNAVGLPRVEDMLKAGIKFCLGNDGFSNSMWAEWKAAYFGHKLLRYDPRYMPADIIQEMAITNNRELVETHFNGLKTGMVAEGYAADLIFVDYVPFTELNKDNLPWHIIFGFRDGMVSDTMVNGKFLMQDREILFLSESEIFAEAKKVSKHVWKTYNEYF